MSMNYPDISPAVDPTQDLSKPARLQTAKSVVAGSSSSRSGPGGGEVNLWSGRRMGERGERTRQRQRSGFRCHPLLDVGRTRGSRGHVNTFCLYFARGMCTQGAQCPYLHRLPTKADEDAIKKDSSRDIFGREKVADDMDNRKGAGSYDRDMTTLYCHYGGAGHYTVEQLRDLLVTNFSVWGPIHSLYIVTPKTIAFIRYHWRASAEFAREAMDNQGLEGSNQGEVLSLRWANEDPNPVAVTAKRVRAEDALEEAALAAWDALPPDEKRARLAAVRLNQGRKLSAVAAAYPDTSAQYEAAAAGSGGSGGGLDPSAAAGGSLVAEAYPDTERQYAVPQQGSTGEAALRYTEIPLEQWQQYQQYYYQQQQQQAYYDQAQWSVPAAAAAAESDPRIPIPRVDVAGTAAGKAGEGQQSAAEQVADPLALLAGYGGDSDEGSGSGSE